MPHHLLIVPVLAVFVLFAAYAPPPRKWVSPQIPGFTLIIGCVFAVITITCLLVGYESWCALTGVICEIMCGFTVWLARPHPNGFGRGEDNEPSPWDWDDFDRLRSTWELRERAL